MSLTTDQVRHVAMLSRLALDDEQTRLFARQLSSILDHIGKLDELDTSGVEPTSHAIPMSNVFRSDAVQPSLTPDEALANAPHRIGDAFGVPKVVD